MLHQCSAIRTLLLAVFLLASPSPASSATIAAVDQSRIAAAIATKIHENGSGVFKTKRIEIGRFAIERPWAIADWQSEDGNVKGQVILVYRCDHWNVAGAVARVFSLRELVARGVPQDTATRLLADLVQKQPEIAYAKLGQPGPTC
jgi:hypothetical protein